MRDISGHPKKEYKQAEVNLVNQSQHTIHDINEYDRLAFLAELKKNILNETASTQKQDLQLADSTYISDSKNKHFLYLIFVYSRLVILNLPDISDHVLKMRILNLYRFVSWLSMYKVTQLAQIMPLHIKEYSEGISRGLEHALQIPHRTISELKLFDQSAENRLGIPLTSKKLKQIIFPSLCGDGINRTRYWVSGKIINAYVEKQKFSNPQKQQKKFEVNDFLDIINTHSRTITIQNIQQYLIPLDEIWKWRIHFDTTNQYNFNPFPYGSAKLASALGKETERTKSVPPRIAFKIMGDAAKWVVDYAPIILKILSKNTTLKKANSLLKEVDFPFKIFTPINKNVYFPSVEQSLTLVGLERLLVAACFIVISSLSARRKEEILTLHKGSMTNIEGERWLTIYIEKTLQRHEAFPISELMAMSVEILEELSNKLPQPALLFDFPGLKGSNRSDIITKSINHFYQRESWNKKPEDEWHFSPHQFRRFFALIYFYRYNEASIGILSHHLRHFDIEMTRRYITDSDFLKEMNSYGEQWSASFLNDVIQGNVKIGGKAGSKILTKMEKLLKFYRKKVNVIPSEIVIKKIMASAKSQGVEFTQHVWGTICACPKKTALSRSAKCSDDNGIPNMANGSELTCGACPFSIFTRAYPKIVNQTLSNLKANLHSYPNDTILYDASKIRISRLEQILAQSGSIRSISVGIDDE